jgi:hypothetical protein
MGKEIVCPGVITNFDRLQDTEENSGLVKKYCEISQKYLSIWKI